MSPSENTSSPLKTSWEAAFNDIERSPNPGTAVRFVLKSAVFGTPPNFYEIGGNSILPTYKENTLGRGYTIRELGPVYVVTRSSNRAQSKGGGAYNSLVEPDRQQTGLLPPEGPDSITPADNGNEGLSTGEKVVGGAILLYVAYKGLQAFASAGSKNSALGSSADETTGPSFSQLARAASRLDDKQYNVFVSHSWGYDDHYERIVDFLDEVPSLTWQNHSVPSTDPLPVTTDEALRTELRNQMKSASVVVVSSGMYGAHSKWIPEELDLAKELGKPIIALVPDGQSKVPKKIQEDADTQVGWRKASLIDALAEYA